MSLLLFQILDRKRHSDIIEMENIKLGELKVIRFMKNLRSDRIITLNEKQLLIDWENGNKINEDLE